MTDYVYAEKGWEVKVGDVCEHRSIVGRFDGWQETQIAMINVPVNEVYTRPDRVVRRFPNRYHRPGPFYLVPTGRIERYAVVSAENLRKRRPPEQKDSNQIAEPEFIEQLNSWLNKEKVES